MIYRVAAALLSALMLAGCEVRIIEKQGAAESELQTDRRECGAIAEGGVRSPGFGDDVVKDSLFRKCLKDRGWKER